MKRIGRTNVLAVEDLDVVLCGVWPKVKLDDADAVVQGLDDGRLAAAAAQLVPRQVRVVPRVDEVVRQRQTHLLVNLHQFYSLFKHAQPLSYGCPPFKMQRR
jgi:hypothetical protein